MQRLILKTVGITLAVVFGTIAMVFGVLTLFYPKAMGELFDGCGNYTATVWFYEKQYNSTESFEDLKVLVDKLDEKGDCNRADKYTSFFIARTDFKTYSESLNLLDINKVISVCEFYYGKCALAKAYSGKILEAVSISKSYVEHYGYTDYNPFKMVIASAGSDLSKEELTTLKTSIEALGIGESSQDIQDIQLLINAKGE